MRGLILRDLLVGSTPSLCTVAHDPWAPTQQASISGLGWLQILRDHFTDAVWLNPERLSRWRGTTIEDVGTVMPMFPMSVDGLTEAMALLNRGVRR